MTCMLSWDRSSRERGAHRPDAALPRTPTTLLAGCPLHSWRARPSWNTLAVLLTFMPSLVSAQADSVRAVVEGRVTDPHGTPIPDVELVWQSDMRSVLSRPDGSFSLVVPFRGPTVVLVRRVGYNAQALRVDLTTGMWRGNIVLEPGSFVLPDIVVSVRRAKPAEYASTSKYDGFFQRQRLGLGTFISREEIERMNAFTTLEILRGIPGVSVNVGNPGYPGSADIHISRCQAIKGYRRVGKTTVWIDGRMLLETESSDSGEHGQEPLRLAEMLARISPGNIEMVEVYRGVSEIPGQFHWDGCAAIVIWTRYNRGPRDTTATPGQESNPLEAVDFAKTAVRGLLKRSSQQPSAGQEGATGGASGAG